MILTDQLGASNFRYTQFKSGQPRIPNGSKGNGCRTSKVIDSDNYIGILCSKVAGFQRLYMTSYLAQ